MKTDEPTPNASQSSPRLQNIIKGRVMLIVVCLVVGAACAIGVRLLYSKRPAPLSYVGEEQASGRQGNQAVAENPDRAEGRVGAQRDRVKGATKRVERRKSSVSHPSSLPRADYSAAAGRAGSSKKSAQVVTAAQFIKFDEADRDEDRPKYSDPDGALRLRRLQLQDEKGYIPPDGLEKARKHVAIMKVAREERLNARQQPGLQTEGVYGAGIEPDSWEWLGPGNIGGRIRSIVIDPNDEDNMWIGSVSGGIWRTTDEGTTWQPVNDFLANLAVSTMVLDPDNPSTMYAGTGEGFFNVDALQGAGIFKSTDAGVTWNQLASTNPAAAVPGCVPTIGTAPCPGFWFYVNRLAISADGNPLSSTLLAVTNSGVARSTDDGVTWTQRTNVRALDIDFVGGSSTLAVAGELGSALFSSDAGQNWTAATFNPPISNGGTSATNGRVELATAPPFTVYASVNQNSGEVYRSEDGGQTYRRVTLFNYNYLDQMGWYSNAIWVNPLDSNWIIAGGIHLWRGLYDPKTQSMNMSQISIGVGPLTPHADHHVIVSHPNFNNDTNRVAFLGNDGGIWRCDDTTSADIFQGGWTELNNTLGITQFYGAAVQNSTGVVIGGTQDNGTLKFSGNTEGWTAMFHSDGGYVSVDQTDDRYIYGERQNLQLVRSTDGGNSASFIFNGITDACPQSSPGCSGQTNFIAPLLLDPNEPNTLLAGGWSLWRSTNVRDETPTWAAIKGPTAGNSPISAIAVSPISSNLMLVGHNNGDIYSTINGTDAAPTWTQINTPTLQPHFVTRLVIDPNHSTNWYYATFGGFSGDNVWRSTDNGATWADVSGTGTTGLPSVPVRAMAINPINPRFLYVGTEIGIFTSEDAGATWDVSQDGPSNVSVDELFFRSDNTLYSATHGRGVYRTSTPVFVPPQVTNTADSGTGSLRNAITITNNVTAAERKILFNITGGGVHTINVSSPLPAMSGITIDGWSQAGTGYTGPPLIELNGAGAVAPGGGTVDGLIISDGSLVKGLAINRFSGSGIRIDAGGSNRVRGCYIGTDAAGTSAAGNSNGIFVNNSPGNIIGRQTAGGERNVISGNNQAGIVLAGPISSGNIIRGNLIGTDVTGNARLGNLLDGIRITNAFNNTIGGTETLYSNIISGNGTINFSADGIEITGATSSGNIILNNYIGLAANGNVGLGNLGSGIRIENAPGTIIGGTDTVNVIADNRSLGGIALIGAGSSGTTIQGNYIGTNHLGEVAIPNNANGVYAESANNTIGGIAPGAGNLISGYDTTGGIGIFLFGFAGSTGNVIQGNLIGTDADGTEALSRVGTGIQLRGGSSGTLIGGDNAAARNIISGNATAINLINVSDTRIQGNRIGTNLAGTAAVPNVTGVVVDGGVNSRIGGDTTGAGNIISGNGTGGNDHGIRLANTTGALVQGNRIGTNAAGTGRMGNGGAGIQVFNSTNCTIGGATAASRNLISANDGVGISLGSGSSGTIVQGNYIGTDVTGTANFGNGQTTGSAGIEIQAGSHTVGGTNPGAGNIIAYSGCFCFGTNIGSGIRVFSSGNRIRGNSIFGNAELAIDLSGGTETLDVTANDSCDIDTGPNNLQNFPVLTSATTSGVSVSIAGSLNSTANTIFIIDFYASPECDASGHGESQLYLGSTLVTTDAICNTSFNVTLPGIVQQDWRIVATATDPTGNTSELSACVTAGCGYAVSPLSQFFPINGGSGSLNIFAGGSSCNWLAFTKDDWITITSSDGGSGNDSLTFEVRENFTGSARQGVINVSGQSFSIVQDGGLGEDCDYSISPTFASFSGAGGVGSVNVLASDRCAWQAISSANWITIISGGTAVGNGTVGYSVTANPGTVGRAGTITIAGKSFAVKQKGS